jgi:hypothetical protein
MIGAFFLQLPAMSSLAPALLLAAYGGFYAFRHFRARAAQSSTKTDLVIESIHLDPPDGSILPEQTPVFVTVNFRFSKPAAEVGVWVRIFDETYRSQYYGAPDRALPGRHSVTRGAYLTEPGELKTLTVVFKNPMSAEILRQDIPVNYTYVADPALKARKNEGVGSVISRVVFKNGRQQTVRKGTYIPVILAYAIQNAPNGLYASAIADTKCSATYAGMPEPINGNGEVELGFTLGEACAIKRVKVLLRNDAEGYVYEEFVDVDITIVD